MNFELLITRIKQAPELDFGNIFDESIALFKKVWTQGLVILLLSVGLMLPAYLIIYLPLVALGILNPEVLKSETPPEFYVLIPFIVCMIILVCYAMVVTFMLRAGFYRICRNKDLGLNEPDNYFYYFKRKYIPEILKLGLSIVGISILAMLLCGLPMFYAMVPISFFVLVFAFNPELTVSEIIKVSFALGNKKWLLTFGLMLVTGFLAQIVGMLLCFIGILATASFAYLPLYIIYKKVIGLDEEENHQEINTLIQE